MDQSKKTASKPAIVLSGGGSRGAYEAGIIHYIRTQLPQKACQKLRFSIYSGSSVGAINVSFLASTAQDLPKQGNELIKLWSDIRAEKIYKRGAITLGKMLIHSTSGALFNLLGLKSLFAKDQQPIHFQGLLNTRPFFHFLLQNVQWNMITKNIQNNVFDAIAIAATNTLTGNIELFLDHRPDWHYQSRFIMKKTTISPRHVMASAALPVLFPSVPIDHVYYNDAALRMNTPLTPAVHLGATDLMTIATSSEDPITTASPGEIPALGDLMGTFIYSILQDRLETDEHQLQRINRILHAVKQHTAANIYQDICEELNIRPIQSLSFKPSQDITVFVDEELRKSLRSLQTFGALEKTIIRLLEIDQNKGSNLLSYFLFEPTYIQKLIELGMQDARAKHDQIMQFIENL
ncbi:MAG: patatin-like phospholipase family protein [Deltaproteobacteria bacterium]|nr:patatin-like phospholipase family protein [Deltaproteobacteria bacterium]